MKFWREGGELQPHSGGDWARCGGGGRRGARTVRGWGERTGRGWGESAWGGGRNGGVA